MLYNIYNIDERIYLPITIVLTLIILVICSFHFYKKKKIALNTILSIWSICLSFIAFIAAFLRVDVYFTNDSFVGIMAGFMGACATILVGVQIYNSIDTRNSINKLNESFEEKIEQINTTNDQRMRELNVLNNKAQFEIKELYKKIEETNKEQAKNENIMQAYINRAYGFSLADTQPFTACMAVHKGLIKALENNDIEFTKSLLNDLDVISNRMSIKHIKKEQYRDIETISEADYEKLEEISPDTLKSFQLYPLISEKYNEIFKNLQYLKQQIDESKEQK